MSAGPPSDISGLALSEWLEERAEQPLDPDQLIIDSHHHLWDRRSPQTPPQAMPTPARYLGDDFFDDVIRSGHRVVESVFVECRSMYRAEGGSFAPCGEIEFVQGVAAMASADLFGEGLRCCGASIGFTDLTRGAEVGPALDALSASGRGFRGIRQAHGFHPSPDVPGNNHPTREIEHLLARDDFRAGFAELAARDLLFECWGYHFQLLEVADLARAFPGVTIVLDHIGGPMAMGPFASQRETGVVREWTRGIEAVAACPNVVVKVGGCGMPIYGFGFEDRDRRAPSSEELALAWKPYFATVIGAFGPERSMFESNFPVDKVSCSYGNLWNAFKRIAAELGFSQSEKDDLFFRTAARVYALSLP